MNMMVNLDKAPNIEIRSLFGYDNSFVNNTLMQNVLARACYHMYICNVVERILRTVLLR